MVAAPMHVETVRAAVFDPLTAEQVDQLREISLAISAGLLAVDRGAVD